MNCSNLRLRRRQLLRLAAGAAALPALARIARAQAYPSRPVRLIFGFAAGGSADIVARLIAQFVSGRLGQPVIVENRTGASSNLAGEAVAVGAGRLHAAVRHHSVNAINATFFDNPKFDLKRDFAPVSGVTRVPNVLEVNPSVPANNVAEFIAYVKANPGKLNMASTGNGTSIHLADELFKASTGTNLVHVPYRSPPQAMTDLLVGQVQVKFDVMTQGLAHIKEGRLRALAVTTATRSETLPDVPTRLRRKLVERRLRACGNAVRDRRSHQQGDQCRADRSENQGAAYKPRQHGDHRQPRRVRSIPRRGNRQMGQGGSRGQHQGGVTSAGAAAPTTSRRFSAAHR
jgi:tripartite-type tricarboxylate transporter receptor subunit TctC